MVGLDNINDYYDQRVKYGRLDFSGIDSSSVEYGKTVQSSKYPGYRFIKLNPSSPALDYALYMRGVSNFNESLGFFGALANQDLSERDQKASREAWQAFRQLLDQFPQSRYVEDAKLRMDFLVNSLAAYEVHVARYYFRRGAYIAAANRAQSAVSEFQSAPATEEALFIMARSYEKLDLLELRDSADRVLRTNYPDSRFLPDGRRAPEAAWWHIW